MTRPEGLALDVLSLGRGRRELIFLHGFGASRFTWRSWRDQLGDDYRLHLLDLKGFGTAARPRDAAYSPTDLAREVVTFLTSSGVGEYALVGHSMGGGIALSVTVEMARLQQPPPGALILVGAAAYPQTIPRLINLARLPLAGAAMSVVPARTLARMGLRAAYHPDHTPGAEVVEGYADGLRGLRARWAMRQVAARIVPEDLADLTSRYPTIGCPTLLLWGNEDRVIPRWVGDRLHRELPDSELVVLDQCGHVPPEERPEASLGIVSDFLARRFPATP